MKKIYLSLLALSIGVTSFGQTGIAKSHPLKDNQTIGKSTPSPVVRSKGATLYSFDFSTPSNWTIGNLASNNDDWVIGTGVPSGSFAINGIQSTTAANGFALYDSDLMCSGNQNAYIQLASPINLLTNPNVSIEFEQYYRRFQDSTFVEVSNNGGTTWTRFRVNDIAVNDFGGGSSAVNPQVVNVNISSVAGGQAAVLFRFKYEGGCDYAWMVDDVKIIETDDNDLAAKNDFYGFNTIPYTRVPSNQIQPVDFSMEVDNVGAATQTGVYLNVDVNSGTFVGTSATTNIASGASDSLFTTTQYTPAASPGAHNITMSILSDSVDASPANNTITPPPFEVTADMYAMDDFTITGNGGGTSPTNEEEFEAGNYFEITTNTIATGIEVVVGTLTPAGTTIDFVLYEDDGTNFVEIDRSNFYTTTTADQGNSVTLALPQTPAVTAGKFYFAAVHAFTEFYYGVSGSSPGQNTASGPVSLIFYGSMTNPVTNENFFTTATPMVRLIVNTPISVNELDNNTSFSVYPNPSNGDFNISLNSQNAEMLTLTVN
ncbi:MAG: hypothetical protein OQJ88_08050, partial [Flavobacteriales bacterium]|nr:hypothetical protein [Flavobacteriales bacterium]MCW8912238.1 hypothetical protein [Flavobacteriales bacterium]MCW8936905.1 hypothetical protein [Flavobacteriales bacterium]MCW8940595.1 hypothetical protein [Flavobacteriales bacterium]MCW8968930.1 hypothetical protein [Flavobacteriales bacterium]